MSEHVDHGLPALPPATLLTDAELEAALGRPLTPDDISASQAATAVIQQYVERDLVLGDYIERHFGRNDGTLQLLQYPVQSITSVLSFWGSPGNPGQPVADYRVVRPTGILLGVWGYEIEVTYTAGYIYLPADLRAAFLLTFGSVSAASTPEVIAAGGGPVSKVSVTGVGSVEYEFGSAGSGGGDGIASPWGLIPANAVALLRPYRNHGPVGVG
jgi:hypothetical protein